MFKHSDKIILSADIGGSHITTGLIYMETLEVIQGTIHEVAIDAKMEIGDLLFKSFLPAFKTAIAGVDGEELAGIAIAMPGPFDYCRGIFKLSGLDKFGHLYGVDFRQFLYDHLDISDTLPICFKNDADCFGLGAYVCHRHTDGERLIGITLGTGLGSAFVSGNLIVEEGLGIPPGGHLYNQPLKFSLDKPDHVTVDSEAKDGTFEYDIAEELISSRGILRYINEYDDLGVIGVSDVRQAADIARTALTEGPDFQSENDFGDNRQSVNRCLEAFRIFGLGLGACLKPWYDAFKPEAVIIGGGIAGAADLFVPALREHLEMAPATEIIILDAQQMQKTPLIGAASVFRKEYTAPPVKDESLPETDLLDYSWRKTHQRLLPRNADEVPAGMALEKRYNIYPYSTLGAGKIGEGYDSLARQMLSVAGSDKLIALDGYTAVDWRSFQKGLASAFSALRVSTLWIDMQAFAKTPDEIEALVLPFLGEQTSVWGTKTNLRLNDLFDQQCMDRRLINARLKDLPAEIIIIYGTGAGLPALGAPVVFVELPKNEIQYRMRAGKADNLLTTQRPDFAAMYKRAYFVDWPILDKHRTDITDKIRLVVDGQWRTHIHWMLFRDLYAGFDQLSRKPIRARPWFAPGAWGGDWMKEHFPQLSREEVNYAWSFELIVPENGLVFESDGLLLEVPFDWLMACRSKEVLGKDSSTFGHYFPIRFDFLDTYRGGNLSIQCHPSLAYIRERFGEQITQDETYYILDAAPGAGVYLGFQEGIDPPAFKSALEQSQEENRPIDIQSYVQLLPASKHDLFLIPNQTVHSAGVNNLVLEISATPYIFTFKMYDWLRPDLNGKPRPINIEHAFKNLDFNRRGEKVQEELCSKPIVIESGTGLTRINLPTHPEHFYAIHRLEIRTSSEESTSGKCHIMMVVEGPGIVLELPDGRRFYYAYAETFVVPAATGAYRLIHPEKKPGNPDAVKVVKAFIK